MIGIPGYRSWQIPRTETQRIELVMIGTTADDTTLNGYVENIVRVYREASPDQLARGIHWYRTAHDLALIVGDGNAQMGAGIIAALSANKRWRDNSRLAMDAGNGIVHGHTSANLEKVRQILEGTDPLLVLPEGMKTWNFYRAILDPSDPDPVVVDRHAFRTATNDRESDRFGLSNPTRYATLALAFRLAARRLGVIPSTVQAVTWVVETER